MRYIKLIIAYKITPLYLLFFSLLTSTANGRQLYIGQRLPVIPVQLKILVIANNKGKNVILYCYIPTNFYLNL